jgi:hypothetical protein
MFCNHSLVVFGSNKRRLVSVISQHFGPVVGLRTGCTGGGTEMALVRFWTAYLQNNYKHNDVIQLLA